MNKFTIIFALIAFTVQGKRRPVNKDLVNEIKAKTNQWIPLEPELNPLNRFEAEHIKRIMGVKEDVFASEEASFSLSEKVKRAVSMKRNKIQLSSQFAMQTQNMGLANIYQSPSIMINQQQSYDFRKAYPGCVNPVRDQLQCGACWAFAASGTLENRYCMATGSLVILSPQYMINCLTPSEFGCSGGYLDQTFWWLESDGTVLDSCQPYTSGANMTISQCTNQCVAGSSVTNQIYKCASNTYQAIRGQQAFMNHLVQ